MKIRIMDMLAKYINIDVLGYKLSLFIRSMCPSIKKGVIHYRNNWILDISLFKIKNKPYHTYYEEIKNIRDYFNKYCGFIDMEEVNINHYYNILDPKLKREIKRNAKVFYRKFKHCHPFYQEDRFVPVPYQPIVYGFTGRKIIDVDEIKVFPSRIYLGE